MNPNRVLAPIAAAVLAATALTTGAATAGARPATSCRQLAEQLQRDYDIYQQDVHKYGAKSPTTEKAYDAYQRAKHAYAKCL